MQPPAAPQPAARPALPLWIILLAFALLLGFLTVLALGLNRSQNKPLSLGQPVPAFELTTFSGETIRSSDLAGKVVVLNFWASWCKPCEEEAAALESVWRAYREDGRVIFLGAAYADAENEARRYLQRFDITYPNGPDLQTSISQQFHTRGVPETYFIDRNGNLARVKIGPFQSAGEIEAILADLLN